ncbi:MAG TPA: leucine--tRNA ligase [Gemmatimonadales bacterium]|jgi:leucyl-tRNA synthetase|nr:leucine--tRNA ligase [Gemmatimonadales bacterium]
MSPHDSDDGYRPDQVEAKWQARWAERHTNEPDLDRAERPFYNLMMFPYPSAEGLHVGNVFAFTGADVFGRFQRLRGKTVFEPMGFDAFGIHSENFALKMGTHPAELIPRNIANFRRQLTRMGGMFDWRHELSTTDPAYYKWTQWVFLQLYHAGKAYRKKAAVNWCPRDKTVLANEQVIAGACERCGAMVEQRFLEQWFFRITDYAERLLGNLDDPSKMDWSASTATAQRNWIGRSEGAEIEFPSDAGPIRVFTTRPDTLFGGTFLVLAPEHPLVDALTVPPWREAMEAYRKAIAARDLVSRKVGEKEKTGVFTGSTARNPATGQQIPVWVADYVLMEYGTGAIGGVPGHDERDFEFATKFRLPIVRVLAGPGETGATPLDGPAVDTEGFRLVNSGAFSELPAALGIKAIVAWLEREGHGKAQVRYRLHDWCISRQRYWGPPIPIIHCDGCGPVPVPEKDLPVVLPVIADFQPDDSGISPLARHKEWYEVACPGCGKPAHRETDVSDTFLDSGWYYLRFTSTEFDDRPFDDARVKRWLPVASYIGGNEHAVLHLLYSRFLTMVLHDQGRLAFEEPFRKFRAHGTIVKDGAKMSKTRGNVVIPDQYIARWGADTFRTYMMFLGPYEEGGDFRDEGLAGPRRFLDKVWELVQQCERATLVGNELHHAIVVKWHQTKQRVTEDLERLSYNTAIAALMELLNALRAVNCAERKIVKEFVIMLSPFAPHFAEECWERLGSKTSVFDAAWPSWDPGLTEESEMEIAVQINGKTRSKVRAVRGASEPDVVAAARRDPTVRKFTDGKELKKVVYVKDRLLNLVVG